MIEERLTKLKEMLRQNPTSQIIAYKLMKNMPVEQWWELILGQSDGIIVYPSDSLIKMYVNVGSINIHPSHDTGLKIRVTNIWSSADRISAYCYSLYWFYDVNNHIKKAPIIFNKKTVTENCNTRVILAELDPKIVERIHYLFYNIPEKTSQ